MPPYDHCSLDHMFSCIAGRTKTIAHNALNAQQLPRFEEFSLDQILKEMKEKPALMQYLPSMEGKKRKHCRKFVCTILATLEPDFVKTSIMHAYSNRIVENTVPEELDPLVIAPEFQEMLE